MVVDDFDLVRMAFSPDETDSPLIVDADRVLSVTFSPQRFKPVAWRDTKIVEPLCVIDQT